jgi:hypothetical protein
MQPKPILAWVNSYGPWDPNARTPVETAGCDHYLDEVVHTLSLFKNRITDIYLSGGLYDQQDRTECETVGPELKKRLATQGMGRCPFHIDEASVTSISIVRTFVQTWHASYPHHLPILFTDEARYETNAYALEYFIKKYALSFPPINEILIPIKRLDNHPDSTPERQAAKLKRMKKLGVEVVEQENLVTRKEHLSLR